MSKSCDWSPPLPSQSPGTTYEIIARVDTVPELPLSLLTFDDPWPRNSPTQYEPYWTLRSEVPPYRSPHWHHLKPCTTQIASPLPAVNRSLLRRLLPPCWDHLCPFIPFLNWSQISRSKVKVSKLFILGDLGSMLKVDRRHVWHHMSTRHFCIRYHVDQITRRPTNWLNPWYPGDGRTPN